MRTNLTLFHFFLACLTPGVLTADWQQFRGELGSSATLAELPVEFGGDEAKHIAWRKELPGRAVNGPVVVGDRVITTASSGDGQKRLHIFCLDDNSGEIEWERRLWATGRTLCHPLSAIAAPTPATDGERIYALFASNDLVCLSMEGDVLWMRALSLEYPGAFDDRGLASSPGLVGDTIVVQIACSDDSNVFGIDAVSGKTQWTVPLAKETNWASPCEIKLAGRSLVMMQSAERLLLIEPETGDVVRSHEATGNYIPSPSFANGTILLPADGMTALQFLASDEEAEILWQEAKVAAESSSPIIVADRFYVIRSPNLLTAASLEDGSVIWKTRLKGSGFWATPLHDGKHLFVPNSEGLVQVVKLEDGEVVGENDLDEEVLGSPAASRSALYIRGTSSLFKISAS